jgi:flagellar motor switch protein FliM
VILENAVSQEEPGKVFKSFRDSGDEDLVGVQAYDFRRPDRIAKDQLRAIHQLHENFARSLSSSLSAYLRAYAMVNLVSVEQLSFAEFSQCLPAPTCVVALGMRPFEGSAVLELNPSLVFPILEMLLGGSGKVHTPMKREITEIERTILEGLLRIILHDLKESWRSVTALEFKIEQFESEPQLIQILAPNEAVVAVSIEVRLGENSGMINLGIPSIIIKMLKQKFDQQWSVRKSESGEAEVGRIMQLVRPVAIHADARLTGPTLVLEDVLNLDVGDVLAFDFEIGRPLELTLNGKTKYIGQVASNGRKRVFEVQALPPL